MTTECKNRPCYPHRLVLTLCLLAMGPTLVLAQDTPEHTFVNQLLAHYRQITSVSCDVRRDVTTPDGTIRWLSRVYFQHPNRLHAANAAPLPRLIIADGSTMFQHTSGNPRGFRRSISELDESMRINLERIPGTLMEHLLRLRHAPEEVLEPTPTAPIRRAYNTEHVYAVIEADKQQRLLRIRFRDVADHTKVTAEITCEGFEEVIPGVWIGMLHQSIVHIGEQTVRERIRFSNYTANSTIPPEQFDPSVHYTDTIEWVDNFNQL